MYAFVYIYTYSENELTLTNKIIFHPHNSQRTEKCFKCKKKKKS